MIDLPLTAYSDDCRIVGRLELDHGRLSDLLNDRAEILLRDVQLESLDDGRLVDLPELTVAREELCVVEAAGPRGEQSRRIRTREHRLQVQLGPYLILGQLHTLPGADPFASVLRRGPMVPLTNATLFYVSGGVMQARDADALVVNRDLADWVRPASTEHMAFPNVPILLPTSNRAAMKDLTGYTG